MNTSPCTTVTGYVCKHNGFECSFNYKSTGLVFPVLRVPSKISSNILRGAIILPYSSGYRCFHFLIITLFRSAFLYFASNIICILGVELTMLSDLKHSSTYKFIKYSSCLIISYVRGLKSHQLRQP